ncbi:unnamed protein product, partial [Brassica oleracea]
TSESEEEGKIRGRNDKLTVEGDLREMGKNAAWSVSSCKPGNGVNTLRDDDLETFWQSDGLQPHLINIQFQKKVRLQEMKSVELVKPSGWVCVSMSGSDPPYVLHFQNYGFLLVVSLVNNLASCSDKMNRVFATSSSRFLSSLGILGRGPFKTHKCFSSVSGWLLLFAIMLAL